MSMGERIHYFRTLRGMTQKYLGVLVGFPEKSANVRMAQYEAGIRTPKKDVTNALAKALDVAPDALTIPDIDTDRGLMHTLFALSDLYGLEIDISDEDISLRINTEKGRDAKQLSRMLGEWKTMAARYHNGEISREEYDRWRYHYPQFDPDQI